MSPAGTDPFDASLLNGLVFVNRRIFRASLKRLCLTRDKHVLAVAGPPGTGKTYSYKLINHIAQAHQPLMSMAYIDLKKENHAMFKPDMLARRVMRQMGCNSLIGSIPKLEDSSSPSGWIKELCDWLSGEAHASGKVWIVVLDGFDHVDLRSETNDMVIELVNRSVDSQLLRVVLLSYQPKQVASVQPTQRIEFETLTPLTRQDLHDFVASHARQSNPNVDPGDIDRVVDQVWTGVTELGPRRTEFLAEKIAQWVQS